MRFLSLFSGIESVSVAWPEWECVAVAEIEKFPCAVLKHHYPNVQNLGDVTKIRREDIESFGKIDITVFGFPCTDLSIAGQRKGLKNADGTNTRSGLFFVASEIADWAKSRWTVIENVPGLFSSNGGRDFASVVGELAGIKINVPGNGWRTSGVALGPKGLVEWTILDAQRHGLAQRRQRVFIVRDSSAKWRDRPPLFLNAESMSWNSAPSRSERKDVAPTISSRSKGGGGLGTDAELDGALIASTLRAGGDHGPDRNNPPGNLIPLVAGALQERDSKGVDSNTKPGHLIPTENTSAFSYRTTGNSGCFEKEEKTGALNCGTDPNQNVVFQPRFTRDRASGHPSDICPALTSQAKQGDGHPCVFQPRIARNGSGGADENQVQAVTVNNDHGDSQQHVASMSGVRRLTVIECSRLQGFPDNYLSIPWRGKPAEECPDGNRYRALGNAMAVPVISWIGKQIEAVDKIK